MKEYCKIQTIYMRDMEKNGALIIGRYSQPEFEYLADNEWIFTEKVDGTNVRIEFVPGSGIKISGRKDKSLLPTFLINRLNKIFSQYYINELFEHNSSNTTGLTLYGEGYGKKIQNGDNYNPNGVDFALFDVLTDDGWLCRADVALLAERLNISVVPVIGWGSLDEAVKLARDGFKSIWGDFTAEGIVLRPTCELRTRCGDRIIAKIKHKDFENVIERD